MLVKRYSRPSDTSDTSNGDRNPARGNSDSIEKHVLKDSKVDRRPTTILNSSSKKDLSRSSSKKSLSFFPSVEYSGESSESSEENGGLEANNNSGNDHKNCRDDEFSSIKEKEVKMNQSASTVRLRQSGQDDASSTSSCSCEDHSSAGSQTGEDLHGDLDYDDDDDDDDKDDEIKRSLAQERLAIEEVGKGKEISKLLNPETITTDLEAHNKITSPTDDNDVNVMSQGNHQKDAIKDDNRSDVAGSTKKITSFINYDHGHDDETKTGKSDITSETKKSSRDRAHKSYGALLKYFFKDACYFQIKSINHENVALSKTMGVWSTPMQNEIRLNAAFREHRNVILIFSVQQSGAFQGFARIVSESRPPQEPVPWVLPERLSNAALGGVFRLEWLCTKELNFNETRDLYNIFNNNKPVKVARDGQQVEPKVGRKLCTLFPKDSKKRLLACVETLKIQSRQRKQLLKESTYYPLDGVRSRAGVLRRPRNGLHARLDTPIINGFSDTGLATPGHGPYHQFYAQPGAYNSSPNLGSEFIDCMRRGPSFSHIIPPNHFHGSRQFPIHGFNAYQRQPYYNHAAPILSSAQPNVHDEFYPIPFGQNSNPHRNVMHRHAGPDQHSRPYNDWTAPKMDDHVPYRYHPYQRPKR